MRNTFQARNPARVDGTRLRGYIKRSRNSAHDLSGATYPEVPAGWPNRATRRAVRFGKDHRLSAEWRQVFIQQPKLRAAVWML